MQKNFELGHRNLASLCQCPKFAPISMIVRGEISSASRSKFIGIFEFSRSLDLSCNLESVGRELLHERFGSDAIGFRDLV